MRNRSRNSRKSSETSKPSFAPQEEQQQHISGLLSTNCYEGERLACLLKSLERDIETAKLSKGAFPDKIWIKQQFSIGVNDVTRVLERMMPNKELGSSREPSVVFHRGRNASSVQLQAVLVASDCNPRWLTRHLPSLASSRKVPLIFVKDKKGGSLRLGELVKLKTAIAIGVKVKGSGINKTIEEILQGNETRDDNELPEIV